MKTLVIANQKGGVGKTTITAHLGWAAAEKRKRVLLIDLDPQGNLSSIFGAENAASMAAFNLFTPASGGEPEQVAEHIAILRATPHLTTIPPDSSLVPVQQHVQAMRDQFDYCFIDVPPSLGVLQLAGLVAADYVLTPTIVGALELEGLAAFFKTVDAAKSLRPASPLRHIGILPFKTHGRRKDEQDLLTHIRAIRDDVMNEELGDRAAVPTATALQRPVWYATKGGGHQIAAKEWRQMCAAVFKRMK